jgi:hypothetical protein
MMLGSPSFAAPAFFPDFAVALSGTFACEPVADAAGLS